ncbi:peptidyl-tRNA hydrolase II, partial [Fistulina hepatica ATCC 64428]
ATLACYKALKARNTKLVSHWERIGQAKIALKAKNEVQLIELETAAKRLDLCARAVNQRGVSENPRPVVLAVGPAPVELVNMVTGKLRLL